MQALSQVQQASSTEARTDAQVQTNVAVELSLTQLALVGGGSAAMIFE
jgi:hypothetical protein